MQRNKGLILPEATGNGSHRSGRVSADFEKQGQCGKTCSRPGEQQVLGTEEAGDTADLMKLEHRGDSESREQQMWTGRQVWVRTGEDGICPAKVLGCYCLCWSKTKCFQV